MGEQNLVESLSIDGSSIGNVYRQLKPDTGTVVAVYITRKESESSITGESYVGIYDGAYPSSNTARGAATPLFKVDARDAISLPVINRRCGNGLWVRLRAGKASAVVVYR